MTAHSRVTAWSADPPQSPNHASISERLLAAVGEIVERLIAPSSVEDNLLEVLAIIGRAAEVSRVRVFRMVRDASDSRRTEPGPEWCAPGIAPANRRTDLRFDELNGDFSRWGDALMNGRVIIGRTRDFPLPERTVMERQQVVSVAIVPVYTQRGLWGFIGFDDCVCEREWPVDLINTLGIFARMVGAAFDRADYSRRQSAIEASYDGLLDNLNEGVFKTDHRGCFIYLNEAWRTLTGYTPHVVLGKFCGHIVGSDERRALRAALLALLHGDIGRHRCETKIRRSDGSTRWVQISVRRVENAADRGGLAGTIVDISANKQAEEHLLAAKQTAEAANRAKSEFLSTMSHELRTPLNAVIGLSESLMEAREADPARSRRYLELIHDAGRQLHDQINAILDLARVEAGRLKVNLTTVDIGALCVAAVDLARGKAKGKDLRLEAHLPSTPITLEADERLIGQSLQNLIFNAVKFTPPGGRVSVTASMAVPGQVAIAITDTGIGIASEKLPLLFKPFSQIDSSLARRFGGSGLGLVLADRFVRLHGGTIAVASELEAGSTFTISLPLKVPIAKEAETPTLSISS